MASVVEQKKKVELDEAEIEAFIPKKKELEVDKLFRALVKAEGSDLHLKVGRPPMVRVRNELRPLNRGPINDEEMVRLLVPKRGG